MHTLTNKIFKTVLSSLNFTTCLKEDRQEWCAMFHTCTNSFTGLCFNQVENNKYSAGSCYWLATDYFLALALTECFYEPLTAN